MGNLWIYISLLSATGDALRDLWAKRALTRENSILFTWLLFLLPLPAVYGADALAGIPRPAPGFYGAIFTALPLEIIAQVLYMQALRLSPMSLVSPLLSLSPVFMLVVPRILLGERIGPVSGAGVLLIAGGAYLLNAGSLAKGAWEPVKSLLRERGALYMCLVALLFSITATLSKKAIALATPLHYMAVYWTCLVIGMVPLVCLSQGGLPDPACLVRTAKKALVPALIFVIAVLAAAYALSIAKVACVTSIKRLSALFSIVLAGMVLKEHSIRERLAGGVLMVTGFALIVLSG